MVATPVLEETIVSCRPISKIDSLPNLIEEALANNPELHSIRQDEIIQLAQSRFTGKDAYPQIAAYGTHYSQPGARSPITGSSDRDAFGITAEQPLLDWGENRRKVSMERHQARSHRWNAKVKELDIVYNVTESYWRLVFYREVISLQEATLAARRREVGALSQRVAAREARRAELLVVEAAKASAENELFKARNGFELAAAQLLFYTGRPGTSSLSINERLTISRGADQKKICTESHPEMKRVRSAELAAISAERAAKAGRLPKLLLRGHVEDSDSRISAGTTNLVPDGTNYELGAYVSVPVGRQRVAANAKLDEANARRIQLAADADALSTSLQLRYKRAQNRVEEALRSVTVQEQQLEAAKENLNLQMDLASINNATKADVAKADSDYNQARVGLLKAKYDVKEARAHLDREIGMLNQ